MRGCIDDVPAAIGDCTYVYATTARERGLTKPVVTPERAMIEAREMIAAGGKVAVLFGPERAGLENPDIARANAIISVPVNPEFPSLNLAQCVLLCAYEWRRATVETPQAVMEMARTDFATGAEIDALGDHFEERLEAAGFFFPEAKAAGMKLNLRNLWARLPLTRADVQTLHGMMRQMVRWAGRRDKVDGTPGGPRRPGHRARAARMPWACVYFRKDEGDEARRGEAGGKASQALEGGRAAG
jgi:tRNA/rRNA methyltransferase